MSEERIRELEQQIGRSISELIALRGAETGTPVPDYVFATLAGETRLSALFGEHDHLLVIHNMGEGCRFCTLWADGLDGLLPHLESAVSVVLASPDPPATQHRFAASRGWHFRLVSHGGGPYIVEQDAGGSGEGWPGAVMYRREGETILRRNATVFGPGDLHCALWPLLAMAGIDTDAFTPQFRYWSRPAELLDGGTDVRD
jgi:predicted dithiol-disulfide oxidoreductase (DUF899 family)